MPGGPVQHVPGEIAVLYAEDDRAAAWLFRKRLSREGYQVEIAYDGEEALSKWVSGRYDVLATDHDMPNINGLELIRKLSAIGPLPLTIMITGHGNETIAVEAMKLGADDYIIKDSECRYVSLVAHRIEEAIKRRRLIEEKRRAEDELRQAHDELELRVAGRTGELLAVIEELNQEIAARKRAEMALKKSEKRFREFLDGLADAPYEADASGVLTYTNKSAESLTGLPLEDLIGKPFLPLFSEESRQTAVDSYTKTLQGETVEYELTFTGGRTAHFKNEPLRDDEGRVVGVLGIARDITERKAAADAIKTAKEELEVCLAGRTSELVQANEQLARSENEKTAILNAIDEMVAYQDLSGKIVWANRAWAESVKQDPRSLEGRYCFDIWHGTTQRCNDCPPGKTVESGRPEQGEISSPDGRFWSVRGYPVKDADGLIIGLVEVGQEITAAKKVEEAFRETSRLNQILIDSMPCVALLLRPGTREIVASNAAGVRVGAVPGTQCFATWGQRCEPCPWCLAPAAWETGEAQRIEVEALGIVFDAYWIPISPDLYMHYAFDVTEQRRAEHKIKASLEQKEALLREIHHRVKNNLAVISSIISLQSHFTREKTADEVFQALQSRIRSMATAHELLYQSEDLAAVAIGHYVRRLIDNLHNSIGVLGAEVEIAQDIEDISFGLETAVPLGFIITELTSNAFKHAFGGVNRGEIRISLRSLGEQEFELVVADNGVGLPDHVDLERPHSVGLELVSTFVEQLHGRVEIIRRHGTEVRITFRERKASRPMSGAAQP